MDSVNLKEAMKLLTDELEGRGMFLLTLSAEKGMCCDRSEAVCLLNDVRALIWEEINPGETYVPIEKHLCGTYDPSPNNRNPNNGTKEYGRI